MTWGYLPVTHSRIRLGYSWGVMVRSLAFVLLQEALGVHYGISDRHVLLPGCCLAGARGLLAFRNHKFVVRFFPVIA